jgi:predicted AlkP superfamily pyrophosphatase or phosphodiesterase
MSMTTAGRQWLLTALVACLHALTTTAFAGDEQHRLNAPEQRTKPYLVLVSIDGFRWDFASFLDTPGIDRLASEGLSAEALLPVFPTLTFPNHFSIATGQLPRNHGIVANEFPHEDGERWYFYKDRESVQDGQWYLAEPIWVTAEKQGMLSAAFFFVGTEADISGKRPTHWRAFDADVPGSERVEQVLHWLAEPAPTRPHVITLYFEDVDDNTHWYGPGSAESVAAIGRVDVHLQKLLAGIDALPHGDQVYVFLVSDHGMAAYDPSRPPFVIDQVASLEGVRAVEGGPYVFLHFDDAETGRLREVRDAINNSWDCGRALLPDEAPPDWQLSDSGRFPDLIAVADPGCAVLSSADKQHKVQPGDHGWAPDSADMRGVFYAWGPRIPPATRVPPIRVTDIYPLMLAVLDLPAGKMDGDPEFLPSLLLPEAPAPSATGDSERH